MIKNNMAAVIINGMTLNNSVAKGKAMQKKNIEKVPSYINAKGQKSSVKVDPQINADIDRLMVKLCN